MFPRPVGSLKEPGGVASREGERGRVRCHRLVRKAGLVHFFGISGFIPAESFPEDRRVTPVRLAGSLKCPEGLGWRQWELVNCLGQLVRVRRAGRQPRSF